MAKPFRKQLEVVTPPAVDLAPSPWIGITTPLSYSLRDDGLYFHPAANPRKPDDPPPAPYRIAGPLWVSAETRRYDDEKWSLYVHFLSKDARSKEKHLEQKALYESNQKARSLVSELVSSGLEIVDDCEALVASYLKRFRTPERMTWSDRTGWIDGSLAFVLTAETLQTEGEANHGGR